MLVDRTRCPVCDHDKQQTLLNIPFSSPLLATKIESLKHLYNFSSDNFVVAQCDQCHFVYQKFIPAKDLLTEYYNVQYDDAAIRSKISRTKLFKRQSKNTLELYCVSKYIKKSLKKLRVLDFGMGQGDFCVMAKKLGCDIYGFDIQEASHERASKHGIPCLRFDEIASKQFDFINTEQVVEHLDEPRDILLHLSKCLSENGIIKVSVPNGRNVKQDIEQIDNRIPNAIAPLEHLNCFNHHSLLTLASACSLEPIHNHYLNAVSWLYCAQMPDQSYSERTYLYFRKRH